MQSAQTSPASGQQGNEVVQPPTQSARATKPEAAWAFWLVFSAVGWVTVAFLIVMLVYSRLEIFDKTNVANITAALSSLFGIVGTLVGAYFGIKATTDAQGKVESLHSQALATNQQAATDAQRATADATKEALMQQSATAEKVAAAASTPNAPPEAKQQTTQASFVPSMLTRLAPLAGTAGLMLIMLRYLKGLEKRQ
jgi:hypothetical protein